MKNCLNRTKRLWAKLSNLLCFSAVIVVSVILEPREALRIMYQELLAIGWGDNER